MVNLATSEDSLDNDLNCNVNSSSLSHMNEFILNSFLHVTILFAFLSILFYYLIAPLAVNGFKSELSHIINDTIDDAIPTPIDLRKKKSITDNSSAITTLLTTQTTTMDYNTQELPFRSMLNTLAVDQIKILFSSPSMSLIINNYIDEYSTPNTLISLHNSDILNYGYYISLILFIITFTLIIFIKYSCNSCINLTKLLLENILTFAFIGFIEFWFFTNYAAKFIPAVPSLLINSAFENIKSYLK